jgi:uncharacterized caspase-like protein
MTAHPVQPPSVRIVDVGPSTLDGRALRVDLEITPGSAPLGDVRLYRDGMRVARIPATALVRSGKGFKARIEPIQFRSLGLYDPVRIEATAFDAMGIRSSMARSDHKVAAPSAADWVAPRVWMINIGVNRHDNPAFDLGYAANDAKRLGDKLAEVYAIGNRHKVVRVSLTSEASPAAASKALIREAMQVLAGAAPRSKDARLALLERARPDDSVMITFSGHGLVGEDGEFYLLPSDTGPGDGRQVSPALLSHAISSKELAAWLDGMDSDQVTLVLDACHAAAAVDVNGFVPGPMDSAGLGQLAYDKGFAVLVATQADDVALESNLLQQGLLSYALTADALDRKAADHAPRDGHIDRIEWLRYGVIRVPELARAVRSGKLPADVSSRGATAAGARAAVPVAQTPALFYFARGRQDVRMLDLAR